jgi:hypothetical protein
MARACGLGSDFLFSLGLALLVVAVLMAPSNMAFGQGSGGGPCSCGGKCPTGQQGGPFCCNGCPAISPPNCPGNGDKCNQNNGTTCTCAYGACKCKTWDDMACGCS